MALQEERIRSIIESILLISAEAVPVARIVEVITMEDPKTDADAVRVALDRVVKLYADPSRPLGRGFRIDEVGGGYQLRTVPENAEFLRRFLAARPQRLSKPALETLAVIAYRQPVTKPDIEAIRGVDVGAVLKALLDRNLVRIIGKKDEVGRPLLYGTAKEFLEFFGLRSLAELPTLREYHELDEANQAEVDDLFEGEAETKISDLASAASFLLERDDDEGIDEIDQAVLVADRVRHETEALIDPKKPRDAARRSTLESSESGEAQTDTADDTPPDGAEAL